MLIKIFGGFLMALADSVPGVSGFMSDIVQQIGVN